MLVFINKSWGDERRSKLKQPEGLLYLQGRSFPGIKRPRHEADNSAPSTAAVGKEWSCFMSSGHAQGLPLGFVCPVPDRWLSQRVSGRSLDRPRRSRFPVVVHGPLASAPSPMQPSVLTPKFNPNTGSTRLFSSRLLLSSILLSKNIKIKLYRTVILPVVLYGCETWSLTLREERGMNVFENRVLRRIFGPKRDGVTG